MAPVAYSGALQPKKKSELQEIASALRISDQGTKDDLQARIKKHLDSNQDALEDNPTFAGLFGRRKRSVQPQSQVMPHPRYFSDKPRSSTGRRITALDPIREATPVKDLRDVSTFLKQPISPQDSTPAQSPRRAEPLTPSSLPPLPPSAPTSVVKQVVEQLPKPAAVKAAVGARQQEVLQNGYELLVSLRAFLSNSRNIWSLTSIYELGYILFIIIPWRTVEVPISPRADAGPTLTLVYPPSSVFQTYAFWTVILHWALPTLIVPTLVGCLISFNPNQTPSKSTPPTHPVAPLDPLSASIVRLAAQTAYPYTVIATRSGVTGIDILGTNWRIWSASVGLAFAFAEAIAGTPQVVAKEIVREQRRGIEFHPDDDHDREATPTRRALMAREDDDGELIITLPSSTMSSGKDDLKSSTMFASASSLMALQLFSRGFTFLLNQALFRLASPRAFGAASIQFELILSTILFLSREGVRNALLRVTSNDSNQRSEAIKAQRTNLSFLPVLVGIPLAVGTAVVYVRWLAGEEVKMQPGFKGAVGLYAFAAVMELLSEPLYNVAMGELKTGTRVRAEGLGITTRSVTTFLVLLYDAKRGSGGDLALLAFAVGQLMYSVVMFATYVVYLGGSYMRPRRPPLLSSKSSEQYKSLLMNYIDKDILYLTFTMTSQSLVKHFLTEGDKVILSWFSPLQDQGGYALAVNYGSLVARIIFQPIEESLRLFFSRTLGGSKDQGSISDEKPNDKQRASSIEQAASTLNTLLSVQTSISLIFVVFASAYLPILLPALLPAQYLSTSAPRVLAAWVWYIPVLAVNGGLEAFLSSVATPKDLNVQSRWMIGFSAVYILSALFLYQSGFGDASLVYANIVNLTARIIYALRFISHFFSSSRTPFHWQTVLIPSPSLIVASTVSALSVWLSERTLKANDVAVELGRRAVFSPAVLLHIGIGGVLGLISVGVWWIKDGKHVKMRRSKVD
ncbi:Rft protein-domain-containing protein [Gymnopilus junonius]|uniref:Man(5)GlcNAc(2)-PP-dolichol translocation protein RFT1 n=1 Tax=Gymnopilus junonius TaxID=109634 RepID=A0A9P5NL23_GYMJU|nr:Rft protein-domain-containing protein [Gymnopilus junonius]